MVREGRMTEGERKTERMKHDECESRKGKYSISYVPYQRVHSLS